MKKYCISIGEDNAEKSLNVQNALFAAGFEWSLKCGGSDVEPFYGDLLNIGVNVVGCGMMSLGEAHGKAKAGFPSGTVWLPASYVLAHASELDGAKKPWEIAEEGRRFVTDDERDNNEYPEDIIVRYYGKQLRNPKWKVSIGYHGWCDEYRSAFEFTVPISFTFAPPVARMTHAQICKALGKNIEIIKESE